jgi:HTH-type transcriptional regulator / antitoxin HigA
MTTNATTFQPDWISPPGATISRVLTRRGMSFSDFATEIDAPVHVVQDLVQGIGTIDEPLAKQLANILGASPTFWMDREREYRADAERLRTTLHAATSRDWLRELPVRDMVKFGWIEPGRSPAETVDSLLRFFAVPDIASWRTKFRRELAAVTFRTSSSFTSNPAAAAAWLRWAEVQSEKINCELWDPAKFMIALETIRAFTRRKNPSEFVPQVRRKFADAGVALVVAPTPSGCQASGGTRFLSPTKALMVLSFRYRSDDHFWFTLFHEAGHILLHGKDALFLEDGSEVSPEKEEEANGFAGKMLIPTDLRSELLCLRPQTREVIRFSIKAGVSPGVVVGQLQHMGRIGHTRLNKLKRRYVWTDPAIGELSPETR